MGSRSSPRILILRMSAIGDTILSLPALCALRARFPQAHLCWVVEAPGAPLLREHPEIDELIVLPRRWFKSPREIWKLVRRVRAGKFDIALDLQCRLKTALVGWLSGAPQRIGYGDRYAGEGSTWFDNCRVHVQSTHLVDRSLELLAPLGIQHPAVTFGLPIDPAAQRTMRQFLQQAGIRYPFAVLSAGASWASKVWPPERYGLVAQHLADKHHMQSVVIRALGAEQAWSEAIVANSAGHAVMAPPATLVELAALLHEARLFLGNDTGPMHLAVAVGTPCIVLHGTTRPQDCGPYGSQHIAIQEYFQAGNRRYRKRAANDAMRAIQVERVSAACDELLARPAPARHAGSFAA
ncbi:MAG: glycosyltransferase family 9 protein [Planctomycetaceae bacterium]|nr:glycosyltransferase family 9 protein [Planctomycetaceae bacterium]